MGSFALTMKARPGKKLAMASPRGTSAGWHITRIFPILNLQERNLPIFSSPMMEANPGTVVLKSRDCEINSSGPCLIHRRRVVCAVLPFMGHVSMLQWKLVACLFLMIRAKHG